MKKENYNNCLKNIKSVCDRISEHLIYTFKRKDLFNSDDFDNIVYYVILWSKKGWADKFTIHISLSMFDDNMSDIILNIPSYYIAENVTINELYEVILNEITHRIKCENDIDISKSKYPEHVKNILRGITIIK